jgi:rhodanese-related sulfurtransferase
MLATPSIKFMAACAAACLLLGALGAYLALNFMPPSQEKMMKDFYATEVATSISPADFVSSPGNGNAGFLAVDLRSRQAYEAGHLITAINIPVEAMDSQQVIAAFSKLPKDKPIVTYCYSSYCMLSRQAGKVLSENGIYVKHMTAGWYEINRDYAGYVVIGTEPGAINATADYGGGACTANSSGQFSC